LVTGVTPGLDIPLSMERVESSRNFANKLWNMGRYIRSKLGNEFDSSQIERLALSGPMTYDELSSLRMPERFTYMLFIVTSFIT